MSFWSGEKLLDNRSVIKQFNPKQVDANAYNLTMGDCYFVTNNESKTKVFLKTDQPFIIPPGQFAYLMSREELNIPANAMAFISMRTGIKFKGLINVSGFHVDPGYSGKLIYAAYNASPSPLHISEGEQIFKIWFVDLDRESGRDHLFKGSSKAEIGNDLMHGMSKEIYSLPYLAEKVETIEANLAKQTTTTDFLSAVWNAILTGIFVGIAIALMALLGPTLLKTGDQIKDHFYQQTDLQTPSS